MVRLTRWLTGWIEFSCKGDGGKSERFLTLASRSGILLWGIRKQGENGVLCRCRAADYAFFRPFAARTGARLHLCSRHGLCFRLRFFGRRKGMTAGLALAVVLLWLLSGKYWVITVQGDTNIPTETLLAAAREEGLYTGADRSSVNTHELSRVLRDRFPQLSWLSVNTDGCTAQICLEEGTPKPQDEDSDTPANLLASADGKIKSIDVFSGTAMVQPGDGVIEGQLLISGIVESETGSNHAVFARGKVVAETRREFTAKIPMEQIERKKTGETLVRESVLFFGLRFPVTLRKAPEGLWEKETEDSPLTLLQTSLPVSRYREIWSRYEEVSRTLTEEEAQSLAWDAVLLQQREMLGKTGRVVSQEWKTGVEDGGFHLTVRAVCEEEIGVSREIVVESGETG